MHKFNSGGVEIAYETAGEGAPILLIHGFASNGRVNWWDTGWVKTLVEAGRRVITFDHRGHGHSEKLYDSALYPAAEMAEDARRLLDHLGIGQADVMGYSMGARVSAFLTIAHPERVRRAVFAGLASRMITGVGGAEAIARALEAPSKEAVADMGARSFRIFAEQTKSDRGALAACIRGSRQTLSEAEVARIGCPALVAIGTKDDVAGDAHKLAAMFPAARALDIPNRDHNLAVGDKVYKQGVLEFLEQRP